MSIDISQFHETFLEEAGENLTDLEKGLLDLEDSGSSDMDAIFRAAHSIKGGAATFGFSEIAEFTHVVESVLQRARDGELEMSNELITLLLSSVDVISELLSSARAGETDTEIVEKTACLEKLNVYMKGDVSSSGKSQPSSSSVEKDQPIYSNNSIEKNVIEIEFKPNVSMPNTGSDPVNIFKELKTLGEISVKANVGSIPTLEQLSPEELYLWWEIELVSESSKDEVMDAFLFVEDEAEITINIIASIGVADVENAQSSKNISVASADEHIITPAPERRAKERRSKERRTDQPKENSYIRVAVDKVDSLINLVGELVTTNAMVEQQASVMDIDYRNKQGQGMERAVGEMAGHTRNLQEAIMAIRMMPIDFAFSRFPRMVRDVANKLNKKVELVTSGKNTELDKTVIERITDPLTHLVRNSIDHGLELPVDRLAAGKPEVGTVSLDAFYRGGSVIIEVKDDGKGLNRENIIKKAIDNGLIDDGENLADEEVWQFIMSSGFSTAAEVTDVSGRGVGMDVVARNIKSLGGTLNIESAAGEGSCFRISLPLTLAIVDGMAIKLGCDSYIVPLLNIIESVTPHKNIVKTLQDGVDVLEVRGEYLPLLHLNEVFKVEKGSNYIEPITNLEEGIALILETDKGKIALFVDDLIGERQVVIKNIEDNYKTVEGVSGATILGDGSVALILDVPGLIALSVREGRYIKPLQKNDISNIEKQMEQKAQSRIKKRSTVKKKSKEEKSKKIIAKKVTSRKTKSKEFR